MDIGEMVTMNKLSNYAGKNGIIKNIDDGGRGFMIELENGLTLKAPIELISAKA